jgi:hypothetical protein
MGAVCFLDSYSLLQLGSDPLYEFPCVFIAFCRASVRRMAEYAALIPQQHRSITDTSIARQLSLKLVNSG